MCEPIELNKVENGSVDPQTGPVRKQGLYMDEAITETKYGLFHYVLIFLSSLVMTALMMEKFGITFVFPVSQCDLNLTPSQKGFLGAVSSLGIICSSHLWGYLADTKGRRRVIQPTLVLEFVTSIVSSLAQDFYLLSAARFLNGFFIGGSSSLIFVYVSEFHNKTQRSRAIMVTSVISSVLCVLIPVTAWAVINQDWEFDIPFINITYRPWRLFLVVCGLPGLISFMILMFLPESPKFILGQGKQTEAYEILCKMNLWNNGKASIFTPTEIFEEAESIEDRERFIACQKSRFPFLASVWNQTGPLFRPQYLRSSLLLFTVQFSTFYTSQGLNVFSADIMNKISTNLDDLVNDRMMMCDTINIRRNETVENVCVTKLATPMVQQAVILQVLYLVGYVLVSLLITKVSKFPIVFSILVGGGIAGIACMLTNIPLLQIGLITILLVTGVASNLMHTVTVELYPTSLRAMAICISLLFGRIGSMLGSQVSGLLLEKQCELAFYVAGVILIASGALTFFIPNIHKKSPTKKP